jgi:hypothetical protein
MKRHGRVFLLIASIALTSMLCPEIQVHAAPIVYSQPSDFPGGTVFASQQDDPVLGFGDFATAYDNFTLLQDTEITDLHWQGGYFNGGNVGTLAGFRIEFWADAAGQPDLAPLSTDVIAGNANETFVGVDGAGTEIYNYSIDLPTPFLAVANTTYWVSIVADMDFPPQWGWHSGTGGDGVFVQDFLGARNVSAGDLALDITGNQVGVVPEPASIALWCLAGGPLLGAVIRRQNRQKSA